MEENQVQTLKRAFSIFGSLFIFFFILARIFGLMRNSICYTYLGCNAGFFGYDGFLHFLSGVALALGFVWLSRKDKKYHILQAESWKNIVLIFALAAFAAVLWETIEFAYDHIKYIYFHIDVYHPNTLSQASNSDTMGDMILGLVGVGVSTLYMKIKKFI